MLIEKSFVSSIIKNFTILTLQSTFIYIQLKIYWRRQDNDPLPKNAFGEQSSVFKGNTLRIANVTKDNRGTYYCVATNVVGQGARRNVDVEGIEKI